MLGTFSGMLWGLSCSFQGVGLRRVETLVRYVEIVASFQTDYYIRGETSPTFHEHWQNNPKVPLMRPHFGRRNAGSCRVILWTRCAAPVRGSE
eukprot:44009-Prorocentrum_minimum.AAC.1